MELTANRASFSDALKLASQFLSNKSTAPIVTRTVRLTAEDDELLVQADSGEMGARVPLDGVHIRQEGEAFVYGSLLSDLARSFRGDSLELKLKGSSLKVKGDNAEADVPTIVTDNWPLRPSVGGSPLKITGEEQIRQVRKLLSAAASSKTMSGLILHDGRAYTTDSYRIYSLALPNKLSKVLPYDFVNNVITEDAELKFSPSHVEATNSRGVFWSQLLDIKYPIIDAMMERDRSDGYRIEFEVEGMLEAIKEIKPLLVDLPHIDIEISSNKLKVATTSTTGSAESTMNAYKSTDAVIRTNYEYIEDILGKHESNRCTLYSEGDLKPLYCKDDGIEFLFMPVKR